MRLGPAVLWVLIVFGSVEVGSEESFPLLAHSLVLTNCESGNSVRQLCSSAITLPSVQEGKLISEDDVGLGLLIFSGSYCVKLTDEQRRNFGRTDYRNRADWEALVGTLLLSDPKSLPQAHKHVSRAAEQGDALGQLALGLITAEGLFLGRNLIDAYVWLRLAKAQADIRVAGQLATEVDCVLNRLEEALSKDERIAADHRLRTWQARLQAKKPTVP